ncbi:MAG TPA: M13 family metallopeptidase N-terminal domain-containing protein, partial [Kofleriaceae bacterium]|nr:M13 family metallopeptidase N-terminal domain-containing protein [Kofleriaceae bacterium]
MRYVACCVVIACSHPVATPPPATASTSELAFDIGAIDAKADPCTDFYAYACGGWRASHPIPPDRTRWSRYAELEELDLAHERSLVEAAAVGTRVGDYDAACLDVAAIDARGLEPIGDVLREIDAIAKPADVTAVIADLFRRIGPMLVSAMSDSDPRDARTTMLAIDIGELGLDEPDDYARADADSAAMRTAYAKHVERLLALAGDRDAAADAGRVVSVVTTLAGSLPRADQRRERAAQVHVMSMAELAQHAPAIDWPRYFKALGAPAIERVNVTFVPYLEAASAVVSDLSAVRAYLRYHVVRDLARVLPRAIDDEVFELAKILRGARDKAPRWKRCLDLVDRDLGDEVGKQFAAAYFPPASRDRARRMVDRIVTAFHD